MKKFALPAVLAALSALGLTQSLAFADAPSGAIRGQPLLVPPDVVSISSIPGTIKSLTVLTRTCDNLGSECAPKTDVTVAFTLMGCVDALGPVHYLLRSDLASGRHVLALAGINLHTERSNRTDCFKPPVATSVVRLDGVYTASALVVERLGQATPPAR